MLQVSCEGEEGVDLEESVAVATLTLFRLGHKGEHNRPLLVAVSHADIIPGSVQAFPPPRPER